MTDERKRKIFVLSALCLMVLITFIIIKTIHITQETDLKGRKSGKPAAVIAKEEFVIELNPFVQSIKLTGKVNSVNSLDLISAASGKFEKGNKEFQEGISFKRGQLIYKVNPNKLIFDLKAKKASFHTEILKMLPTLSIDYPDESLEWVDYAKKLDPDKNLPPLPLVQSESKKTLISAMNIYSTYYTILSIEETLKDYYYYAPFSGTISECFVNEGTMVSSGKTLATFVGNTEFEVALSLPASYIPNVKVGNPIEITIMETNELINAKISRINNTIDDETRSVNIFVEINDNENVFDGSFVSANLPIQTFENVATIPYRFIVDNTFMRIKKNDKIERVEANIIARIDDGIVISGLENGTILSR